MAETPDGTTEQLKQPFPSDGKCWGCNRKRVLRWVTLPLFMDQPHGPKVGAWNCRECEENERIVQAHRLQVAHASR